MGIKGNRIHIAHCLVTLCVAFSLLVGCNGTGNLVTGDVAATQSSFRDKHVGVCIYELNDSFMSLFTNELIRYLVSEGFSKENIKVYGGSNNEAVQLSQVKALVDERVDALVINPVNASVAHTITELATGNSIPVVYINREPTGDEEDKWEEYNLKATYVGCDARQSGIYQGELVLGIGMDKLDRNRDGILQYYMIEGAPENIDAGFRTVYSVSTIKNAGIEMECLLDEVGNWEEKKAKLITDKGLEQGLIPEVIICNNDAMALGAIKALQDNNLVPGKDVFVVGVDALPEALDKIKEGTLVGTVFNDYIRQSHEAADVMINYLQGKDNEHYVACNYVKVTKDNADAILNEIDNKKQK